MSEQQYPEPTVGGLVFDPDGRLLLVRSPKWLGKLVIPGGHIEMGETMEQALTKYKKVGFVSLPYTHVTWWWAIKCTKKLTGRSVA